MRIKVGSLRWLKENDAGAHRAYYREYFRRRRLANPHRLTIVPCPLCMGPMTIGTDGVPSISCRRCCDFLKLVLGSSGPSREEMAEFIKTLTKGELETWQNAITLRKAIRPLQKLLN